MKLHITKQKLKHTNLSQEKSSPQWKSYHRHVTPEFFLVFTHFNIIKFAMIRWCLGKTCFIKVFLSVFLLSNSFMLYLSFYFWKWEIEKHLHHHEQQQLSFSKKLYLKTYRLSEKEEYSCNTFSLLSA